jgi:hypothetical protein
VRPPKNSEQFSDVAAMPGPRADGRQFKLNVSRLLECTPGKTARSTGDLGRGAKLAKAARGIRAKMDTEMIGKSFRWTFSQ